MRMAFICILLAACVFFCSSKACAWTDDVEGMLMPSPRGEDTMSEPQDILENIEGTPETEPENTDSKMEWE